jgi:hypothetical protein
LVAVTPRVLETAPEKVAERSEFSLKQLPTVEVPIAKFPAPAPWAL